jgi:hypothetical protein
MTTKRGDVWILGFSILGSGLGFGEGIVRGEEKEGCLRGCC